MRRFFITVFILSLVATAGALYWRTYLPEAAIPQSASERSIVPGDDGSASPSESVAPELRSDRSLRDFVKAPSERQDLAVTISIVSSVISALAALLQTWLTAWAYRR